MFNELNSYIAKNPERYLSRFNFSACELWLCTEICHILNFELTAPKNQGWFVYNEDYKRDISVYCDEKLLSHIEVKVVYPNYSLTAKKNWYGSLETKFSMLAEEYKPQKTNQLAWVYFIWTSQVDSLKRYNTMDLFFSKTIEDVTKMHKCSKLNFIDVLDSCIYWRGQKKRIVVKALELKFSFV